MPMGNIVQSSLVCCEVVAHLTAYSGIGGGSTSGYSCQPLAASSAYGFLSGPAAGYALVSRPESVWPGHSCGQALIPVA